MTRFAPFPIYEARGTPRELGRQHGEQAGERTILADHEGHPTGICRHPHDGPDDPMLPASGRTVAALIAEPAHGRLHVATGNACENEFATYDCAA